MKQIPTLPELEETGVALLHGFGFKDEEIKMEYTVLDGRFRVDMAGINDSLKVAVEFGECTAEKLIQLKLAFDRVVWLPYWTKEIEDAEVSLEKQYRTTVGSLTKERDDARGSATRQTNRLARVADHIGHVTDGRIETSCPFCMTEARVQGPP